jgi:hypothetical protein
MMSRYFFVCVLFQVVLAFSLPILLLEEVLKFVGRRRAQAQDLGVRQARKEVPALNNVLR